jgi:hypothetical protein
VVVVGLVTAPIERTGVFFEFNFGPQLLGGFIAFAELVLPRLPMRGSYAAGYNDKMSDLIWEEKDLLC